MELGVDLTDDKPLGSGNFGEVWKGKRKESDREKRKRRRKEKEASSETRIKMDRSGRRGENQIMTEDELVMLDVVVW